MALSIFLSETDTTDVPTALTAFEQLRRERVSEIVLGARVNGLRSDRCWTTQI